MLEHEQGTDEWRQSRSGRLTASVFGEILNGTPAARKKLMLKLAAERRNGKANHEVTSKSMSWGKTHEAAAREAFELETGYVVSSSGLIEHPKYDFIACSPDGLIYPNGGCEGKAPFDESVHTLTLLEGMPEDHMAQCQGGIFCTGREFWMFYSFDPRAVPNDQLYVQRIDRDEAYIKRLETALLQFNYELKAMVRVLQLRDEPK